MSAINLGVSVYRRFPLSAKTRRKIKAVVLGKFFPSKSVFQHTWRGVALDLDSSQSIDMRLFYTGDYEPELMSVLDRLLKPGCVAIDVGANIGIVSLWMAKCVGSQGQVVAIEPSSWAVERLEKNRNLNPDAKIVVAKAAASDKPGRASMSVINGYRIDDVVTNTTETVEFTTIDLVASANKLSRVDLIKIDTDGYEEGVLKGALDVIQKFRPTIIFELGPNALAAAGSGIEQVAALLSSQDYAFFTEGLSPLDPIAASRKMSPDLSINVVARPN